MSSGTWKSKNLLIMIIIWFVHFLISHFEGGSLDIAFVLWTVFEMRMTSASDKKHDTFDFFEAIFCWRKCFCNWQSYQQSFIFCLRFTPFKTLPYLQSSISTFCPWFIPRNSPFSLYNAGAHFWLLRLEFIRSSPQDWFPQMLLRGVPRKII